MDYSRAEDPQRRRRPRHEEDYGRRRESGLACYLGPACTNEKPAAPPHPLPRRQTYPEGRPRYESDSESPPPRRRHGRYEDPRDKAYDNLYDDHAANRHRQHYPDEERRPRHPRTYSTRDMRDDQYPLRERPRSRGDYRRDRPGAPRRKDSAWQSQAKDLFDQYAVPVIKKEGAKFVQKQMKKLLAGNTSSSRR
ncbi:hypothetical protein M011DRAFT_211743 [Sporormia fimetaria CBS 119925]|uniref:Uncharacterized protein n=1 Tax=Sporormia fimetaria CBS 119925 TaxID=1340428 RepID=A0A6A6UZR7_9PLEO|nr:hypothetical protein M011DRAFT_211743 [Sporormia fimetaria CBS 119925]